MTCDFCRRHVEGDKLPDGWAGIGVTPGPFAADRTPFTIVACPQCKGDDEETARTEEP